MFRGTLLSGIGICFVMSCATSGQEVEQTVFEARMSDMESRLTVDREVRPAAYFQSPPQTQPMVLPPPSMQGPPATYEQGPTMGYPYPPEPVCRSGRWLVGIDLIPTQFHFAASDLGLGPDTDGMAVRLNVAYEHAAGFGIRGRLWGFGQDAPSPDTEFIEVAASMYNFDVYKRLTTGDGNLVLGVGSVGSVLQLELPDGTRSRLRGNGLGLFADGYYPAVHFQKSELGVIGRGRMSLVDGEWTDSTGEIVPPTDHDTLTMLEVAFGLEFRRRFGRLEDKYWYIGVAHEIQRWDSAWMTRFTGSSAGFDGLNINVGLAW
jgi:hypothetical protein